MKLRTGSCENSYECIQQKSIGEFLLNTSCMKFSDMRFMKAYQEIFQRVVHSNVGSDVVCLEVRDSIFSRSRPDELSGIFKVFVVNL